jgi:heme oxygenase
MELKHMIVEKHKEAEATMFFKHLIERKLPEKIWINFLFNKMLFLSEIETRLDLNQFGDLPRVDKILDDVVNSNTKQLKVKKATFDYVRYLELLEKEKLFAHVYVWYMGDLNGGKMIKKIAAGKTTSLDFEDAETLKQKIMSNINIDMIEEINYCFDWAINILTEFESDILQESSQWQI